MRFQRSVFVRCLFSLLLVQLFLPYGGCGGGTSGTGGIQFTGRVTDTGGNSLPRVVVSQVGTENTTVTGDDGEYSFSLPQDAAVELAFAVGESSGSVVVEEIPSTTTDAKVDVVLDTEVSASGEAVVSATVVFLPDDSAPAEGGGSGDTDESSCELGRCPGDEQKPDPIPVQCGGVTCAEGESCCDNCDGPPVCGEICLALFCPLPTPAPIVGPIPEPIKTPIPPVECGGEMCAAGETCCDTCDEKPVCAEACIAIACPLPTPTPSPSPEPKPSPTTAPSIGCGDSVCSADEQCCQLDISCEQGPECVPAGNVCIMIACPS